jgi:hypothetical protein
MKTEHKQSESAIFKVVGDIYDIQIQKLLFFLI